LGIALSSLREKFFGFSYVTVNGKVIRLLETEPATVGKCLLTAGYPPRSLIGLKGATITITVNGEKKQFPGRPGKNASIKVNQKPANLETTVAPNDEILVESAQTGEKADVSAGELLKKEGDYIFLKGNRVYIPYQIYVNGEIASYDKKLDDGDIVEINELGTLKELSQLTEIDFTQTDEVTVNGRKETLSCQVKPGDHVEWK